jgi:hypothetical protein
MVYDARDYWVFGRCTLFGILNCSLMIFRILDDLQGSKTQ